MLRKALTFLYNNTKARVVKYFRTQEVLKVLEVRHQQELADAPATLWPIIKTQHSREIAAAASGKFPIVERRTWSHPYLPESLHRLHQPLLKSTPYNLRRFSETPIPRRAINLIKNAVTALKWKIEPMEDKELTPEMEKRIRIATYNLQHPNNYDSWSTMTDEFIEDFLVGGYGCLEPALTPYYKRPFKLWPVDGSTIRIFPDWQESTPDKPRYAQMVGLKGERGFVVFRANELIYVRDNPRTNTPFGLGRLEVVFNAVNAFLSAQDMATKAGGDQIHKTFLWWRQALSRGHFDQIRKYIRNEGEGQAKINMVSGIEVPDVLEANPVTEADLLLNWQEFLIRIIGTGFDLSPQALGLERDVNRNTSEVMDTKDFRSGVVPVASKYEETITRFILHGLMQWDDLQFKFIGLDDPDILIKTTIREKLYKMDAITSNQIAEDYGLPKVKGGWGELTMMQKQLMIMKAQALLGIKGSGASGGAGGAGGFPSVGGGGGGASTGGFGASSMPMKGSMFSAQEVSEMSPEEVAQYQQGGMLPQDPAELQKQMIEQIPDIMEKLSDELRDYFEYLAEETKSDDIKPAKVSKADENSQIVEFKKNNKARFPQYTDRGGKQSPKQSNQPMTRRFS